MGAAAALAADGQRRWTAEDAHLHSHGTHRGAASARLASACGRPALARMVANRHRHRASCCDAVCRRRSLQDHTTQASARNLVGRSAAAEPIIFMGVAFAWPAHNSQSFPGCCARRIDRPHAANRLFGSTVHPSGCARWASHEGVSCARSRLAQATGRGEVVSCAWSNSSLHPTCCDLRSPPGWCRAQVEDRHGSRVVDIWQAEDLSDNRADVQLKNAELEGDAERVTVQTADMWRLPFEDNSIDVVLSRAAIHKRLFCSESFDRDPRDRMCSSTRPSRGDRGHPLSLGLPAEVRGGRLP